MSLRSRTPSWGPCNTHGDRFIQTTSNIPSVAAASIKGLLMIQPEPARLAAYIKVKRISDRVRSPLSYPYPACYCMLLHSRELPPADASQFAAPLTLFVCTRISSFGLSAPRAREFLLPPSHPSSSNLFYFVPIAFLPSAPLSPTPLSPPAHARTPQLALLHAFRLALSLLFSK